MRHGGARADAQAGGIPGPTLPTTYQDVHKRMRLLADTQGKSFPNDAPLYCRTRERFCLTGFPVLVTIAPMPIDPVQLLILERSKRGSGVAVARWLGVSECYVSNMLARRKGFGDGVLKKLGLRKVTTVTYRRVRSDA